MDRDRFMKKHSIIPVMALIALSACSGHHDRKSVLGPNDVMSADKKTIYHGVPLEYAKQGYHQTPVSQGYESRIVNNGSEWARYAMQVQIACSPNLEPSLSGSNTITLPVNEGAGHLMPVYHDRNGGGEIWMKPVLRRNFKDEVDEHLLLGVSITHPSGNAETVANMEIAFPKDLADNKTASTNPEKAVATMRLTSGDYCKFAVSVLPSNGAFSRKLWNEGVGRPEKQSAAGGFGIALPGETDGSTLADVMHGVNNTARAHNPDFHDPFDVNRGGFGPVAR